MQNHLSEETENRLVSPKEVVIKLYLSIFIVVASPKY